MNRLKQEPNESDLVEEIDGADGVASGLTNGHNQNNQNNTLKTNGEISLSDDSLQNVVPTYNNNNNSIAPSQAYGGARPKTFRARLRSSESSSCKVRNSDSLSQVAQPVDIRVVTCDQELVQSPILDDSVPSVPKLDSRHPNLRLSLPDHDISKDNIELEAGELVEDDCYIYTYIGGTAYLAADLPNSFFRLDSGSDGESLPGVAGAGQSNLSTGVAALIQDQMVTSPHSPRVRSFSPDQDFIEMDFDPGSDSDEVTEDGDSGQGQDDNDDEDGDDEGDTEVLNDRLGAASVDDDHDSRFLSDGSPVLPVDLDPVEPNLFNPIDTEDQESGSISNQPRININSPIHPASAPVLSPTDEVTILMPRSKSLNSSLGECPMLRCDSPSRTAANLSLCGSRLQQREAAIFGGDDQSVKDSNSDLSAALQRTISPETLGASSVSASITPRAMIWKEKEAMRKQVTQTPNTSSCGAVALVNVMIALELDINLQLVAESVNTRSRRQTAPLPQYLLSRSEAGCTHADLISGVTSVARDRVRARFLPLYQRQFQLAQLLSNWISAGLVPVLTLNVQKGPVCPDGQIQDSWHHQMVWGVQGQQIFLANPMDVVSEASLTEQLDSPSELLIRRADIVSRFQSSLDLMQINRLGSRWRDMNVLGQVVNIIREERSVMKEEAASVMIESAMTMSSVDMVTLTSHINIPASYTAGVTLFCLTSNTKALRIFTEISDLPMKKL